MCSVTGVTGLGTPDASPAARVRVWPSLAPSGLLGRWKKAACSLESPPGLQTLGALLGVFHSGTESLHRPGHSSLLGEADARHGRPGSPLQACAHAVTFCTNTCHCFTHPVVFFALSFSKVSGSK